MGQTTVLPSVLTVSSARANLYDLVEDTGKKLRRFVITHRGQPAAVVLPVDEVESWEETLEILSDKKLMSDIKKAEKDRKTGKVTSLDQVVQKLHLNAS